MSEKVLSKRINEAAKAEYSLSKSVIRSWADEVQVLEAELDTLRKLNSGCADELRDARAQLSQNWQPRIELETVVPQWGKVVKHGPAYWVVENGNAATAVDAGMLEAVYAAELEAKSEETKGSK